MNAFSLISQNVNDTEKFAEKFASALKKRGCTVYFFGDIGVGKTTFIKALAKSLNVKENVTSPSFVIMNEYHSGDIPIYHFDLYRLENEGLKTIEDEINEYSDSNNLVLIEWSEFFNLETGDDRINIKISYEENESRKFTFEAFGKNSNQILEAFVNDCA